MPFIIENRTLVKYLPEPGQTKVIIPDGVECIGAFAFVNAGLEELYLPKSVNFISAEAFRFCRRLKTVYFPEEPPFVSEYAFFKCPLERVMFRKMTE